jgi:hypothetical protein
MESYYIRLCEKHPFVCAYIFRYKGIGNAATFQFDGMNSIVSDQKRAISIARTKQCSSILFSIKNWGNTTDTPFSPFHF